VVICEQEKIKGHIAKKSSGRPTQGYPFRALFIVEKYNKYYDEITDQQHLEINHRLIALKRLLNKAKKFLIE
jgi:inosine/xanthosine triphosphate pyrophosphatase family protein